MSDVKTEEVTTGQTGRGDFTRDNTPKRPVGWANVLWFAHRLPLRQRGWQRETCCPPYLATWLNPFT